MYFKFNTTYLIIFLAHLFFINDLYASNLNFVVSNTNTTSETYGDIDVYIEEVGDLGHLFSQNTVLDINEGWELLALDGTNYYFQNTDIDNANYGAINIWNGTNSTIIDDLASIFDNALNWRLFGADNGILYFQNISQTNYGVFKAYDGTNLTDFGSLSEIVATEVAWNAVGVNDGIVYLQWISSAFDLYGSVDTWNGSVRDNVLDIFQQYDNYEQQNLAGVTDACLQNNFASALQTIENHILGINSIESAEEYDKIYMDLTACNSINSTDTIQLNKLYDIINLNDSEIGPLFMTSTTLNGFSRTNDAFEFERLIHYLYQLFLEAHHTENINNYPDFFEGKQLATHQYFPGSVDAPADPTKIHTTTIMFDNTAPWGIDEGAMMADTRRPTGTYLAAGDIGVVNVPENLVGKGIKVRVGAFAWDLSQKPILKRMDKVSLSFPINSTTTYIANPLGGCVQLEIPYGLEEGMQEIAINNVVKTPFFSAKRNHQTTIDDWIDEIREYPGPVAEFETDKLLFQVPKQAILNVDDPLSTLQKWDMALDAVNEMLGRPLVKDKHTNYFQADVTLRGDANYPGYPFSNIGYSPYNIINTGAFNNIFNGPEDNEHIHFHELGNQINISKFSGEAEAIVNFLYVAVLNKKFEIPLNDAFSRSFSPTLNIDLNDAATMRLISDTFRNTAERNTSNQPGDEVKYQHRGYGHYADIVDLFGWCALENFWYSENIDHENGINYDTNNPDQDDRIYRFCKATNIDLRPLFHFWGIHPKDSTALDSQIATLNLKPSSRIYERLEYYKTLIPANNSEFTEHALSIYPDYEGTTNNPNYGEGWYNATAPNYDTLEANKAMNTLQSIIDYYFSDGEPITDNCEEFLCMPNARNKKENDYWVEDTNISIENFPTEIVLHPGDLAIDAWNWTGPNGFSANERQISLTINNEAQLGTYTATFEEKYGCTTTVEFTLTKASANIKMLLEGFVNNAGQMHNNLMAMNLLDNKQPFNTAPWHYTGTEELNILPIEMVDWVLVVLREATTGNIIEQKAGYVATNGQVYDVNGNSRISFRDMDNKHISIHTRHHLAVFINEAVTEANEFDLSVNPTLTTGISQLKVKNGVYTLYAGDFDGNGIINNLDYNLWVTNSSILNQYLTVDADGNGIINNLDYNLWVNNRSILGEQLIGY